MKGLLHQSYSRRDRENICIGKGTEHTFGFGKGLIGIWKVGWSGYKKVTETLHSFTSKKLPKRTTTCFWQCKTCKAASLLRIGLKRYTQSLQFGSRFCSGSAGQVISLYILGIFYAYDPISLLQYDGWLSWCMLSDKWHYWTLPLFTEF